MERHLVVYRRPRCPYCRRLEKALDGAGVEYEQHDIWADPEAAAFVRSVNGGNETVPTVVLDGTDVRTNPPPAELLRALGVAPRRRTWPWSGGRGGGGATS